MLKSIAFVGTHSSGKSTLIHAYEAAHPGADITIIRGITRSIIRRGFPMEKNSTVDSFTNYIRDELQAERAARCKAREILFSDRTVLDAAAYARVNTHLPRPFVPDYFVDMLLEVALLEACRYDLFVYCPAEFPMQADPFRPIDETYRQQVGDQIKTFLSEHRIAHIIASGGVDGRLKTLTQAINKLHG